MTAEESSSERSVNNGVITGAVTRMMMKTKKPMSPRVTAPMAAISCRAKRSNELRKFLHEVPSLMNHF